MIKVSGVTIFSGLLPAGRTTFGLGGGAVAEPEVVEFFDRARAAAHAQRGVRLEREVALWP